MAESIFISFKSEERPIAEVINDSIRLALGPSASVFYSPDSIRPGHKWPAKLQKALSMNIALVPVLSPLSASAEWINREVGAVFAVSRDIMPILALGMTFDRLDVVLQTRQATSVSKEDEVRRFLASAGDLIGSKDGGEGIESGVRNWMARIGAAERKARENWRDGGLSQENQRILEGGERVRSGVVFYTRDGDPDRGIPGGRFDAVFLRSAKKSLWFAGNTLNYVVNVSTKGLAYSLRTRDQDTLKVTMILPDPDSAVACETAKAWDSQTNNDVEAMIRANIDTIFEHAKKCADVLDIELRLCRFCPLHGLVGIDCEDDGGIMQVDVVTYGYDVLESPIFRLTKGDPITGRWFDVFANEWKWLEENAPPITEEEWSERP